MANDSSEVHVMVVKSVHGTVHGSTIKFDEELGIAEGQKPFDEQ